MKTAQELIDSINVGDIFYGSWGYDQTNIDFYIVMEKKSKTVTFSRISKVLVESKSQTWGVSYVKPGGATIGEPIKKIIRRPYISMRHCNITKWDGKEKRETSYG